MIIVAAVVVLVASALGYLLLIAPVGCSYKAKILGSAYFVTGRPIDAERSPEISADSYMILRLFRARVDETNKRVTASLFGLRSRTSEFVPGLGAVLTCGLTPPRPAPEPPGGDDPWPAPVSTRPKLNTLLDGCFPENNPRRLRRTRAVLVLHDGIIVAERYAPGFSKATPLPGWSMTKAVTGALVGILVKEGKLKLSDKNLLPEWSNDARREISLEDLLRMRSGLKFTEKYENPLSDVNQMLWNNADCSAYAASRPAEHPPGAHWQYSSGTTNIVCRIIRRAVGEKDYHSFPRRALFGPLGMSTALMETDAGGTFVGSSFLFASARDWARFGLLYAQDGVWEGQRILPEGWAAFSASPTPESNGVYGAHWWLKLQKELGGETEAAYRIPSDAFFALGHEDQSVTVIPSRKLVAVRLGLSIYIDAWNHAEFTTGLLDALE
jgi:CubicO group peptidase (beta-lactamase class C family)